MAAEAAENYAKHTDRFHVTALARIRPGFIAKPLPRRQRERRVQISIMSTHSCAEPDGGLNIGQLGTVER